MTRTFVKEWFDLCAAREAALDKINRGIMDEETRLKWRAAQNTFKKAVEDAGLATPVVDGDYTYRLSNGEIYLRDEPL